MKKKIGLLAKSWNGENLDIFIEGLRYTLGDMADIFVFTSHASHGMGPVIRTAENMIYMLPDYSFFDAVILFGSGMNEETFIDQVLKQCKEVNVPVISQGMEAEGISTITVNNYAGMRSLCDHLIEVHQVKNVIFIAGPNYNEDSNLRKQVLYEALSDHGYEFDESKVVYANWEMLQVQNYLIENYSHGEKLPDAFVCANDTTALFALIQLEKMNIKVPSDVIVTGFDNLSESSLFSPSLASVDQRYFEQGNECAKLTMELWKNRKIVKKKMIPCIAKPGESCGCFQCKDEAMVCRKFAHKAVYRKHVGDGFRGCQSRMEMCIMSAHEYKDIHKKIKTEFFDFFGQSEEWNNTLHIYLDSSYKELAYMEDREMLFEPPNLSPVLDVLAAKTDGVLYPDRTMNRKDLLLGYKNQGNGKIYIFSALRIGDVFMGYLVLGYCKNAFNDHKHFEFATTINTALEKYQSNIKLTKINEKLSELMEKDSLTSVKNRIAYDSYMNSVGHIKPENEENKIAIVMCDINNLKKINDSFGHDAGDIYIKNCCNLMQDTFQHSSIYRTGGDEFVILIGEADFAARYEYLGKMRIRMEQMAFSDASLLEKVSIATGLADFDSAADKSLFDVVKRADAFMYINKAEMKEKYQQV